jgi:hypothetical protein
MAEVLTGVERKQFVDVLAEWNVGGNPAPVEWAGRAEEDRKEFLSELLPKQIKEALYCYALKNGDIKKVDETREGYRYWKYHYDLWPTILGQEYYFETRFDCKNPDESVIYIMRFKPHSP